jgi:hypothetical protein
MACDAKHHTPSKGYQYPPSSSQVIRIVRGISLTLRIVSTLFPSYFRRISCGRTWNASHQAAPKLFRGFSNIPHPMPHYCMIFEFKVTFPKLNFWESLFL